MKGPTVKKALTIDPFTADGNVIDVNELTEASDDGFAVNGSIVSAFFTVGPFIWKFDSDGNEEWIQSYTGYLVDSYGITATSDGGYALASFNGFDAEIGIIKTDADGVVSWSQTYPATSTDYYVYAYDVAERTGGVLLSRWKL